MTAERVSSAGDLSGGEHALRDAESEIVYGTLASSQVEMAETELRRLGLSNVRVQHFGELAQVMVEVSDIPVIAVEPLRSEVVNLVRSAGFSAVALDLIGTMPSPD